MAPRAWAGSKSRSASARWRRVPVLNAPTRTLDWSGLPMRSISCGRCTTSSPMPGRTCRVHQAGSVFVITRPGRSRAMSLRTASMKADGQSVGGVLWPQTPQVGGRQGHVVAQAPARRLRGRMSVADQHIPYAAIKSTADMMALLDLAEASRSAPRTSSGSRRSSSTPWTPTSGSSSPST